MVRGPQRCRLRRLGPLQLRHSSQLPREALVVPRTHFPERGRVSPQLRNQRIVSRPGVGIVTGTTFDLVALRRPSLSLPNPAGRRLVLLRHGRVAIPDSGRARSPPLDARGRPDHAAPLSGAETRQASSLCS